MNIRTKRKLLGLSFVCFATLVLLSLVLRDRTGFLGVYLGDQFENHFGGCAFLIPVLAVLVGLWLLKGEPLSGYLLNLGGFALLAVSLLAVLGVLPGRYDQLLAGDLGVALAGVLEDSVGLPGLLVVALFVAVIGGWMVRHEPVLVRSSRLAIAVARGVFGATKVVLGRFRRWWANQRLTRRARLATSRPTVQLASPGVQSLAPVAPVETTRTETPSPGEMPEQTDLFSELNAEGTEPVTPTAHQKRASARARWKLPPLSLLSSDVGGANVESLQSFIDEQVRVIDQTLVAFRVEGKVVSVTPGARVILFEWQPAPGVKASRLEYLADDLALALKAERVRVVVPLPGKGTVGIEIPHPSPADVTLGGLISSSESLATATGDLPLFLGRALTGESLVTDLVQMPHLLIAGTTGSGKSVCIHTILMSLMMKRSPDQLRVMLIDPKRVELIAYRNSPHLLCEVITDAKRAVSALRWVVTVMEARYQLLARYGSRDLQVFNKMVAEKVDDVDLAGARTAVVSDAGMPWIVIAIDELADLMVTKPREVEDALQRLAQMARGVGIHLVVATQRPSVDVLTGVIKANLPSRLSFQVATRVDSRTILDSGGADQLLGKGDMLFSPAGAPAPARAQGAFISTAEVGKVLEFWSAQGSAEPVDGEKDSGVWSVPEETNEGEDPLYEESVALVVRTGEASVSMLQRRLSIGFARAGRLVDIMERRGVVGPKQGSKAREILDAPASPSGQG